MSIKGRYFILTVVLVGLAFVVLYGDKKEGDKGKNAAETLIAMERAAIDLWCKGDPKGFIENTADEFTYFAPALEKRVDGLEAFRKLVANMKPRVNVPTIEIINPKVQIHGDTAVLTFNLISTVPTPEGSTKKRYWNNTEVFSRINGKWMRIHNHWSLYTPGS